MTLRAIKEQLVTSLANLTVPTIATDAGPLAAVIVTAPPPQDVLDAPRVWLWVSDVEEKRLGGPRQAAVGTKQNTYQFQAAVMWTFDPSTSNPLQFDDLIDALIKRVAGLPLPINLTDSVTGDKSVLMNIGENIRTTRDLPVALQMQGLLLYVAVVETELWEFVTR